MALPYKLTDGKRKYGVVATSLEDLRNKAQEKFKVPSINIIKECDGTIIESEEYFKTLEPFTALMILKEDDDWKPAESSGIDDPPTIAEMYKSIKHIESLLFGKKVSKTISTTVDRSLKKRSKLNLNSGR